MKKRLMASLFVCMFSLTLIPTASAAGYTPPSLPDVFQGDGLYITATPFKLPLDVDFVLGSNDTGGFHGGWIGFTTEEEERDEYGYLTGSYAAVHYIDRNGTVFETDADITDNVGSNFGQSDALQFYDGMCAFIDHETELIGYLDEDGNVAIEPQFYEAYAFSDGLAAVSDGTYEGWYYIDKNGNKVLGPYDDEEVSFFSEGVAPWSGYLDNGDYFVGYIDKNGNAAITLYQGDGENCKLELLDGSYTPDSSAGSYFSEGYAIIEEERDGSRYPIYLIIDTKGNEVGRIAPSAPLTASPRSVVHDGLIIVDLTNTEGGSGGGIGAVDIHGNIVIEPGKIASGITYFDSGLAKGSSGHFQDRTLIVDKKGNRVIPSHFVDIVGEDEENRALEEARKAYNVNGYTEFTLDVTNFNDGLALLTIRLMANSSSVLDTWYYVLEVHEGTYTGPGKVYDAATGQVTGGGSASQPGSPARPAADQPSSWAAGQVDEAVSAGIVPENLRSAYGQSITRAEFCALATRLYETVKGTAIAERVTFTDTTDENVEKMAALGVVTGTGDGAFDPGGLLTREQAATMLARLSDAVGAPLPAGSPTFPDAASISSWASEAVGRVQAGGVMSGTDTGAFDPAGPYTREQSILTMLRLYHTI